MKFKIGNLRTKKLINFSDIIPGIINDLELNESFTINQIRNNWKNFVGEIISSHSIPDRLVSRTLFISVDHPVYANEINLMKDVLLKKIDDEISQKLVKNIKAEIKRLKWKK